MPMERRMADNIHRWRLIMKTCLGSQLAKKSIPICHNILIVDRGLKPGFLFDYGIVTGAKMEKLLSTLHRENLISSCLNVVILASDIVITHPSASEQFRQNLMEGISFVDISQVKSKPCIIQDWANIQPSLDIFNEICTMMVNDRIVNIEIEITAGVNVSTLYGLLLGYPIIYWYSVLPETELDNNLSMEPLRNYKILQTTYGDDGRVHSPATQPCAKGDNSRTYHVLYSFSVPECVHAAVSDKINKWWERLKLTALDMLEPEIRMTHESVTLPVVIL